MSGSLAIDRSPPRTDPPPGHANNIDALRLILALMVLFSHCFILAYAGKEADEPLIRLSRGRIGAGELAVDWFFVLSGYLIAQSWERSRSAWSFVRKRVLRIYPGFLVATVVCLVAVVPIATPGLGWADVGRSLVRNSWRVLLLQKFEAPGAFPTNPSPGEVDGSLWTIPFEFLCYLGVLVLGLSGMIRHRWRVAGLYLVLVVLGYGFLLGHLATGGGIVGRLLGRPVDWFRLLPYYLSGVVAYLFRDRLRWSGRYALLALAGLAITIRFPPGLVLALPTLGTYLILYLAFTTDVRWQSAAKYGDFSYGIYLYSYPIQQLIMLRVAPRAGPMSLFALALGPAVLAGVASWYLVERWFARRPARTKPQDELGVTSLGGSRPE